MTAVDSSPTASMTGRSPGGRNMLTNSLARRGALALWEGALGAGRWRPSSSESGSTSPGQRHPVALDPALPPDLNAARGGRLPHQVLPRSVPRRLLRRAPGLAVQFAVVGPARSSQLLTPRRPAAWCWCRRSRCSFGRRPLLPTVRCATGRCPASAARRASWSTARATPATRSLHLRATERNPEYGSSASSTTTPPSGTSASRHPGRR